MLPTAPAHSLTHRLPAALLALITASLLLAGCGSPGGAQTGGPEDLYRPPTLASTSAPTSRPPVAGAPQGPSTGPVRATPTPPCANNLVYLEDLSVPDGTIAAPGEALDKRWLVRNEGTCNWDERYRLQLISGPDLGLPAALALYPARGGSQAELRLRLTAPAEPGAYKSAWQAFDPQGSPFGDPVYVMFEVAAPTESLAETPEATQSQP